MTVCIAGLFDWNYGAKGQPVDIGKAAIVVSDRMITANDIQYEPQQSKFCRISDNAIILISGDYALHSQAIKDTFAALRGDKNPTPFDLAVIYGRSVQAIKRRQAEDIFLAPLGLNTDSFIAQQKEMSDSLTNAIVQSLQSFRGEDVDALIIGTSQPVGVRESIAQIYVVDSQGSVSCEDDVGFSAIGIGATHAKSLMMQSGYVNTLSFAQAMAIIFSAKKAAEIAPGVGGNTDIQLVFRNAIIPLWPYVFDKLSLLYKEYYDARRELSLAGVHKLQEFINQPPPQGTTTNAQTEGPVGEDEKSNVGPATPAAEAAQGNEGGKG